MLQHDCFHSFEIADVAALEMNARQSFNRLDMAFDQVVYDDDLLCRSLARVESNKMAANITGAPGDKYHPADSSTKRL